MDKKLQLLRHLYGESEDRDTPLRDLLQDDALQHEYQELSESKFWLDHTMHERPEQDVLDKIFAAAQSASNAAPPIAVPLNRPVGQNRRTDRAPVANKPKARRRLFAPIAGVFMLLATVGIGYQFLLSPDTALNQVASEQLQKSAAPQALADRDATGLEEAKKSRSEIAPAPFSEALIADIQMEAEDRLSANSDDAGLALTSSSIADTSLPEWNDDLDDVLRFQRRIDMLLEQNQDLAWDEAAVPLELIPAGRPGNPGVRQAGSTRTPSGNQ